MEVWDILWMVFNGVQWWFGVLIGGGVLIGLIDKCLIEVDDIEVVEMEVCLQVVVVLLVDILFLMVMDGCWILMKCIVFVLYILISLWFCGDYLELIVFGWYVEVMDIEQFMVFDLYWDKGINFYYVLLFVNWYFCKYLSVQLVLLIVIDGEFIVYLECSGDVFFDYLLYLFMIECFVQEFDNLMCLGVQIMFFCFGEDCGLVCFIDLMVCCVYGCVVVFELDDLGVVVVDLYFGFCVMLLCLGVGGLGLVFGVIGDGEGDYFG